MESKSFKEYRKSPLKNKPNKLGLESNNALELEEVRYADLKHQKNIEENVITI